MKNLNPILLTLFILLPSPSFAEEIGSWEDAFPSIIIGQEAVAIGALTIGTSGMMVSEKAIQNLSRDTLKIFEPNLFAAVEKENTFQAQAKEKLSTLHKKIAVAKDPTAKFQLENEFMRISEDLRESEITLKSAVAKLEKNLGRTYQLFNTQKSPLMLSATPIEQRTLDRLKVMRSVSRIGAVGGLVIAGASLAEIIGVATYKGIQDYSYRRSISEAASLKWEKWDEDSNMPLEGSSPLESTSGQ